MPTTDGGTLRTIGETYTYMASMGKKREPLNDWQRVLILAKVDVLTVSRGARIGPVHGCQTGPVESPGEMKPWRPMADREAKTETELTALVLQTVRDAGFAWVEAVRLQSYPMRNPNWALTQILGKAPTPIHAFWAQHHPTVAELQERYVLKAGEH